MRSRILLIAPVVFHAFTLFGLVAVSGCGDDSGTGPGAEPAPTPTPTPTPPPPPPPPPLPPPPPPPPPVAPPLYNPVALPDDTLAVQALQLLGSEDAGGTRNCNECHALMRGTLRSWRSLSEASRTTCLTDLEVSSPETARSMLDCLKAKPDRSSSPFLASKLGIYAAAAPLPWFEYVFKQAYGDAWESELAAFKGRVGMPRGDHAPLTQPEFDIVAEWFARGLPRLDETLPEDPPPTTCSNAISAGVARYVAETKLTGWRAVNAENGILMHGCGDAVDPRECLTSYPRVGDFPFGATWESLPGASLRLLHNTRYSSAWWTRSSADGRFVGHGSYSGGFSAAIIDLQQDRTIPVNAFYDPGFFPDNSGLVFQGDAASFCAQSVLTASPSQLTLTEPGCTTTDQVGLYQHVGASLGGGDYWAVESEWSGDNGGHEPTHGDAPAQFSSHGRTRLTPMIHTGDRFTPGTTVYAPTPFEGDSVISPSGRLLVSRLAGSGERQLGYVLRRLIATPGPDGYTVETPELARYCVSGAKPAFSYDERWMVSHHYVGNEDAVSLGFTGPADPAFQQYRSQGASNVYLLDLLTGTQYRVTMMAPGQYALYPHFRSDGWLYFVVRTLGTEGEHIVASDAALMLESTL
jgi:hypothetical protein